MKQKLFLLAFFFGLFCLNVSLFADNDSTKTKDDDDDWFVFNDKDHKVDMKLSQYFENPTIEINYGFGTPTIHKDAFSGTFAKINSGEAKLGFTKTHLKKIDKGDILKYHFSYVFLSNLSSDWQNASDKGVQTNTWQFGFASKEGYGYQLGDNANIVLYRDKGLTWTRFKFSDASANNLLSHLVDTYNETFRFGDKFEAGIKIKLFSLVSVNGAYERDIIMPRHLFWAWAGSEIITEIGDGILSHFSKQIIKASPAAGPIVNFVLMNAYSYGMYELRKKSMNWPFKTASPLMYDNFKVGLNFEF